MVILLLDDANLNSYIVPPFVTNITEKLTSNPFMQGAMNFFSIFPMFFTVNNYLYLILLRPCLLPPILYEVLRFFSSFVKSPIAPYGYYLNSTVEVVTQHSITWIWTNDNLKDMSEINTPME
jgi:hypothetical protein